MSPIIAPPAREKEDSLPPFPVRRWTVKEYMRFAEIGALDEDDNLELIEGWIVPKMTKNPRHDSTIDRIVLRINRLLPPNWYVRTQNGLQTSDSAPEPDVVVVRGNPEDYVLQHPTAADTALVIEVADSSLARDRLKRRMYARAGIAAYWIVNLIDSTLEVYTHPNAITDQPEFQSEQILDCRQNVELLIPGCQPLSVAVSDLVR
jgi:Uma2 family endonuclease